jgi:hypothetical protein
MRIRHAVPVIGLLCLAVAGCTTISQGEAVPATTSDVGTTHSSSPPSGDEDDLPSHGAPKVETPLDDTTRYQQAPCSILTASQAQNELNLPAQGVPKEIALGKGCEWFNRDTRGQVTLGLLTGNPRGLSGIYEADQRGDFPYFIPLSPIEGYPAVASDVEDRRPMGRCIVDVGVTDRLVLDVVLQLSQANVGKIKPCDKAAEVAGMALRTIKEGA